MFEYFPKIDYNFNGITQTVVNVFKSINLEIDDSETLLSKTISPSDRPDKVANDLYKRSDFLWSLFLCNKIKNPLSEWTQTQSSYTDRIETEYDGWSYQFANNSKYLPGTTFYFNSDKTDSYLGVDLSGISAGDVIIYETGTGPFSIKCLGAGGITSYSSCGSPQFGQSLIPDNFNKQSIITKISAGDNFTTCLDKDGKIYAWGNVPSGILAGFTQQNRLFTSNNKNYSFVNSSGDNIIAIDKTGALVCFGGCTAFNASYAGQTGFVKTAWTTNGISGGVGLKTDGSVVNFGLSGPIGSNLTDVSCGYNFCLGILQSTLGITVWGNSNYGIKSAMPTSTGITAISAGYGHALALDNDGKIYGWGLDTHNEITTFSGSNYTNISAGFKHSAALTSEGNVEWLGRIVTYYGGGSCSGITTETEIGSFVSNENSIPGPFSKLCSGHNHIVLKNSGINKKYIGVVDNVDDLYKRIFVKSYSFYDNNPILLNNSTGTTVSVWRVLANGSYKQIKTIQHQLLTIQKYLDSALYMEQYGVLLDPTIENNWKYLYLPNHQIKEIDYIITLREYLMDVDYINKLKISYLDIETLQLLKTKISTSIKISDHINIKTSELL